MRTILTLGYEDYLLPAKANANQLIASLAGAVKLRRKYHDSAEVWLPDGDAKITIAIVKDDSILDTKRKRLPEKSGPEAHGEDITTPDEA